MNDRLRTVRAVVLTITLCWLVTVVADPQTYTLSGQVSDTAAHAVPSDTVSAKRIRGGKIFTARSSGDGDYVIRDLEPGDYKVWAKAGELVAAPVKVTLSAADPWSVLLVCPAAHQ